MKSIEAIYRAWFKHFGKLRVDKLLKNKKINYNKAKFRTSIYFSHNIFPVGSEMGQEWLIKTTILMNTFIHLNTTFFPVRVATDRG